jgi:hypothetical protein
MVSPRPSIEHPGKEEPQAHKKGVFDTVRRQFNKLPRAARVALLALTVATGAGAVHHVTGADVPGPIPVGGIADKVGSTAVDDALKYWNSAAESAKKYDAIRSQAGNASDGAFYISSDYVNRSTDASGSHIINIGGANVTPDAQGYTINNPALLLPGPQSTDRHLPATNQPRIVVRVTYADETQGFLGGDVEPLGSVGIGNQDIVVARQATNVGSINSDGTISMPEGSNAMPTTTEGLSQGVATSAAAPTP